MKNFPLKGPTYTLRIILGKVLGRHKSVYPELLVLPI